MLRQICRRARFKVNTCALKSDDGPEGGLAEILFPSERPITSTVDDATARHLLAKGKQLSDTQYNLLLSYLQSTGQPWHSYVEFSKPYSWLFPRTAIRLEKITLGDRTYNRRHNHAGSSSILFRDPMDNQSSRVGVIDDIWQTPLLNVVRTFFVVRLLELLPSEDLSRTPYPSFPTLQTTVVEQEPSAESLVIEPKHIVCHLTTLHLSEGTYGISRQTTAICWALNRGRR